MSDVNSPFFRTFGSVTSSHNCFFTFLFFQYGPALCKTGKNLIHLDIGSLSLLLLFHTKISIIYENQSKFAAFGKNFFSSIMPNTL